VAKIRGKTFTKNLLTRDEAFALAPEYVNYVVNGMKTRQAAVTCYGACGSKTKQYLRVHVTSTKRTWQNEDGPVVRVSNGEFSWRVDGCDYAYPISLKKALAAKS
jgi:hypothetical protein